VTPYRRRPGRALGLGAAAESNLTVIVRAYQEDEHVGSVA
jgi:hypothetical protein